MNAYLEVWHGSSRESKPLKARGKFTIGRHPESDLVIADESVSRLHAVITRVGVGWSISDLSANGTTVNGTQILGRQTAISSGARITVGSTSIVFRESSQDLENETITRSASPPSVTPAERRVLLALCRPLISDGPVRQPATVSEVAAELSANFQTVKFHLKNLYAKFGIPEAGISRRALLADAVVRSGVLKLSELS